MATSHPFETPVEGDVDVDEAVKQIFCRDGGGRARPSRGDGQCPNRRDLSLDEAGGPAPV